jgi:3-hydroxyisobutyrate dehydrogenase-like beta-hydroxyacid dehydrogenase
MTDVAILGTGRMGSAMARSLARAGHSLVLFNRSMDKAEGLATEIGATTAPSAAAAVAASSAAISMVADEAAVAALYRGRGGVLEGVTPGCTLIEMSTVAPRVVRGLDGEVRERGGAILDAPVSGSVTLAEAGQLTIMVGGHADDLERVRDVLQGMAAAIFHLGPLGSGATIKLAVNAIVFGLNQALAESLVLAERAGVDRAAAYGVFAASAIAAPYVKYKQAAFTDPEATPPAFSLKLAAKDLELVLELAGEAHARMDQAESNLTLVLEAIAAGAAEADLSWMAEHLRNGTIGVSDPAAGRRGGGRPPRP